tara:strand:- start:82 stop:1494 length:1413 start_codon:yes stop_codon:yes gene_type:complete
MCLHFKKLLYRLSFLLIPFIGASQNTAIPDANFEQALIDLGYDTGPINGLVATANINTITTLNVSGENITDLTGIEDFIALTILNCSENALTNLNVSLNINLVELYVFDNQLVTLNTTPLINLKIFWCYNNQLSNLNVTQNTNLISLVCSNNNLTRLDSSNNTGLNVFVCEQNQITALDVTNNTTLNRFQCGDNLLFNLDVSQNTNLSYLSCEQNQISSLNTSNNNLLNTLFCFENQLTELDLSENRSLTNLNCSNNNLCRLNVKNGNNNNIALMDFSSNANLNCVVVDNINGDHSIWEPLSFFNYANTPDGCKDFVPIDSLNDFIGSSYTLPIINNGSYFTESGANGIALNSGDVISTSQTIYIYNETACYNNESSFNVLISDKQYYAPRYFTPNNDGRHDFWNVLDNNNSVKSVSVFNKYGKLLKYLNPDSEGWNGTYNGQLMPTGDYWFRIILNSGEVVRGHFALKR